MNSIISIMSSPAEILLSYFDYFNNYVYFICNNSGLNFLVYSYNDGYLHFLGNLSISRVTDCYSISRPNYNKSFIIVDCIEKSSEYSIV